MSNLRTNGCPPSKSFEGSILEKEGIWWIARIKSNQEKLFVHDLIEHGMDYYLPYYEKRTLRSDGKYRKSPSLVLFPSYVPFISEWPYDLLRDTDGKVAQILKIEHQQRFKIDLQRVYSAKLANIPMVPVTKPEPFLLDDPVEIVSGPFCGAKGMITSIRNNKGSVVLTINSLGCTKATIDVEAIDSKKLTENLNAKIYDKQLVVKSTALQHVNKHTIFTSRKRSLN